MSDGSQQQSPPAGGDEEVLSNLEHLTARLVHRYLRDHGMADSARAFEAEAAPMLRETVRDLPESYYKTLVEVVTEHVVLVRSIDRKSTRLNSSHSSIS